MLYTGTSGYSFSGWVGNFYPPKTKSGDFLSHYAACLNSVEINYTFRRFPEAERCRRWVGATPENFRFSVKMHQKVTHRLRLKPSVDESVRDFLHELEPLGRRLGVVLFQCPPNFRCDLSRLDHFLSILPSGHRFALEFRHASWQLDDVYARLREASVALCPNEIDEKTQDVELTAPFAYLRLRKTPPYSEQEIAGVSRLVAKLSSRVDEVYLYAKHDEEGLAPRDMKRVCAAIAELG